MDREPTRAERDIHAAYRAGLLPGIMEGIETFAAVAAAFYRGLVAGGVPPEAATDLTDAYVVATVGALHARGGPE